VGELMKDKIGTLDPKGVRIVTQAFDEAWATIAGSFEEDPKGIDSARSNLADAVLSEIARGITDISELKSGALAIFARERARRGTLPKISI
jgi:hypothetical protein